MKSFLIYNCSDDKLKGKQFEIDNTAIKTMHLYSNFSKQELRIKSFDGVNIKMSNSDIFIEARLLRKF
mgnify:CR=1 FL=1|jgi:hypothetical protein|tara:strand:- start:598 stop:801 length:204 start_codon:yes stop_codon:yes gene_type:complete